MAGDAGVSVETVYKAFRNKAGLLKSVFDVAIAGDDEPVPMMERDFVAAIGATPEAADKLRMYADHLAGALPRTSAHPAAGPGGGRHRSGDRPGLGPTAARATVRDDGVRHPPRRVRVVAAGCHRDIARDVLWTYNAVELYDLLVLARGWSIDQYRTFVGDALITTLAPATGSDHSPSR